MLRRVLGLLFLLVVASCQTNDLETLQKEHQRLQAGYADKPFSEMLVPVSGADRVSKKKFAGTDQLGYEVKVPYPAEQVIAEIMEHLISNGWSKIEGAAASEFAQKNDPVELDEAAALGWSWYVDGTSVPPDKVVSWWSSWTNDTGDGISYSLTYSFPEDGPEDLDLLSVQAIYEPKPLMELRQKITGKFL